MKVSGDDGAMNGYSVPDPEKCRLARAWSAARYEVLLDERVWPLRIGKPAAALEARLPARDYLWITAWNPPLTTRTDEDNCAADRHLRARLGEAGHVHVPARAGDDRGGWLEPGWLVLDLAREDADALARAFSQGGILHWRQGQPVRLRLMWTRPGDAPDLPAVEWAG